MTAEVAEFTLDSLPLEQQVALRDSVRKEMDAEFITKFEKEVAELRTRNEVAIKAAIEDMQKRMKPPTPTEIQMALGQEYVSIDVKLPCSGVAREFTLCELPMGVERKFYRMLTEKLQPRIKQVAELISNKLVTEQTLGAVFEMLDPTLDLVGDLVALALNPFGEHKDVDGAWVTANLPLWRCWNVIMAQININRVRDFFSKAFLDSSEGMMITKADSQQ